MSISNNSKLILEELDRDNAGLSQTNEVLPDRLNETIILINRYETPSEKFDRLVDVYSKVNEINAKKSEIVTRCNQAFNNNCSLSSVEEELFDENPLRDVFSETGITQRIIPGSGAGEGSTPPIIQNIAFGVIRRDRIRVVFYPSLEDQNSLPGTNNSQEGLIFPSVTSGTSAFCGKGRDTILSINSSYNDGSIDYRINDDAGNWGVDGIKRGDGWSGGDIILGNYYRLTENCGTRRSEIDQRRDQIATLRQEIINLLQPITPLKEKKHGFQLQSWSYRRSQQVNIDTINSNNSLKDFINDPNNNDIFK